MGIYIEGKKRALLENISIKKYKEPYDTISYIQIMKLAI